MPAPQTDTYLLMGSITGFLSFILTLLLGQSITLALRTTAIAIPTSLCGGAIANRRRVINARRYRGSLYRNILELEAEEAEIYDTLQANLQTYQDLHTQINSLSIQHNQLQNDLNHLQNQQHKLQYSFKSTCEQNQQQELYHQQLQARISQLKEQEERIQSALDTKNSFIQFKELRINHLQSEIQKLVTHKQNLQRDVQNLEQQKQDLGGEVYDLQMQIKVLQQRQNQVETELVSLQARKANLEEIQPILQDLEAKQVEQQQLEQSLKQLRQEKTKLESEISTLTNPKPQKNSESLAPDPSPDSEAISTEQSPQKNFWENWQEWLDFTQALTNSEKSALKAILAEDEAQLKDIADLNFVMPQVLVEAINQKALMCLGDTILTAHSSTNLPEIHQEYYQALTRAMAKVK